MSKKIIGIDLGTSNSCVAILENKKPKVLINALGDDTTPSVVAYTKEGRLVGGTAKRQATTNPKNTILEAKRLIGRMYDDKDVQEFKSSASFDIVKGSNGEALVEIEGKKISPVEVLAAVLSEMKKLAEDYLGEEVSEAVITVPAFYTDAQKTATIDAGKVAGFTKVRRIISEPTSATLAYDDKEGKFIVFDLGGGTMDCSLVEVGDGVTEVLATHGNMSLGGKDFDQKIIDWLVAEFKKVEGIDLSKDIMALARLKESAETAKKELSSLNEAAINLPYITANEDGPKHLNMKLSRAKFDSMTEDLVKAAIEPCKQVLEDSKISTNDITDVLLVGGSTRILAVRKAVEEFFNKKANKSLDPDTVVAQGAAIQAGIMMGEVNDVLLLDVTPLSLSIETLGGVATRLIDKNTTIPTNKTQIFSTAADNQPSVSIHVLQGEREMAAGNKTLGKFDLTDLPPAQRGVPQIEVSFDIDADGILSVSAKDLGTGKEQSIKIESSSGLSEEDIVRMVKDAEDHAEEDKKKLELVSVKNQADGTIFQMEKAMKEHEETITEEEKATLEENITTLKETLTTDDKDSILKALQELNDSFHKVSEKIYAQQAPPEGPPPGFDPNNPEHQQGDFQEAPSGASKEEAEGTK
jgi:molecular chaperone DnaK